MRCSRRPPQSQAVAQLSHLCFLLEVDATCDDEEKTCRRERIKPT